MSDPVHALLDELAPDVTRTRLADPSAVRRRGDQRTRRKVAGAAVVGGAAVIAVALLGAGPLRSLADNTTPPTASQTPSVSATTSPSPSTSVARTVHLLPASALPRPDEGSWRALATPLTGTDVSRCLDKLPVAGTTDARWFATTATPKPSDEVAVHRVDEFATDADAHAAFESAVHQVKTCWTSTNSDFSGSAQAGDEAYVLYGGLDVGLLDAQSIQTVVLVRSGTELSVLAVAVEGNGDLPEIDKVKASMPQTLADLLAKDAQS